MKIEKELFIARFIRGCARALKELQREFNLTEKEMEWIKEVLRKELKRVMRNVERTKEIRTWYKKPLRMISLSSRSFTLSDLFKSTRSEWIRKTIACQKDLPDSIRDKLISDSLFREYVAGNPFTPPSLLERLADDDATPVRAAVAFNSSTPMHVLEKLAYDKEIYVRWNLVFNSNISESIIFILLQQPDDYEIIKDVIRKRLKEIKNKKNKIIKSFQKER
jgi:predicted Fe-S protein YdhL (DUF1289 family)